MPGNVELRTALDDAVQLEVATAYKAALETLRRAFQHTIAVLPYDYTAYGQGAPQPSCYAFALGLADNEEYLQLVVAFRRKKQEQPLTGGRVKELLKAGDLRRRRGNKKVGDVVVYFCDNEPQHAGVVFSLAGRIRSKWGPAEVHEHELWEVPLCYGNRVETYVRPSAARILAFLGDRG